MVLSWPERKANIFKYFYQKLVWPGLAMAIAMAMATAMAVIRPKHAEGGQIHENLLFTEKRVFICILIISGPSRPQKWIRLEILR